MSWVDAVILVWVLLAALRGRSLGAVTQLLGFAGFLVGLYLGSLCAHPIAARLSDQTTRAVVTVCVVLGAAMLGALLGNVLGRWSNRAMRRVHLGSVDAVAGAGVGAIYALLSAWLIAGFLAQSSESWITQPIQRSAVLTTVDDVLPPVPSVIAGAESFLSTTVFPQVFANLIQPQTSAVAVPSLRGARELEGSAPGSVLKVLAVGGCGGVGREGTSFVVASDLVMTDAHVVAGEPDLEVVTASGNVRATAVLFDPQEDVAVLRVPGLDLPAVPLVAAVAQRGTLAAVVGYPEDGPLTLTPAGVAGAFTAEGRDIYGESLVDRDIYAITAAVQHGNSGSPLLVDGRAIGMVFSKSESQADTGYALRADALARDLATAVRARGAVGVGACLPG